MLLLAMAVAGGGQCIWTGRRLIVPGPEHRQGAQVRSSQAGMLIATLPVLGCYVSKMECALLYPCTCGGTVQVWTSETDQKQVLSPQIDEYR